MSGMDPLGWLGATIDGKFRVDEVAGEGEFGVVYRGWDSRFSMAVAIKALKIPRGRDEGDRDRLVRTLCREGRIQRLLSAQTACVPQVYDMGEATSPSGVWTPYLIMEWLDGTPLKEDIRQRAASGLGPRTVEETVDLLTPVAEALE